MPDAPDKTQESGGAQPRPKSNFSRPWYIGGRAVLRAYLRICYKLEAFGTHNVPAEGGAILVANHASFLDIPAVGCTAGRPVQFVARESLDKIPLLGYFLRRVGLLYIRRGAADLTAMREIVDSARSGNLLVIYPEGTRSGDGSFQSLRAGVLLAAKRAGVPLVPVGIVGTFEAFSRHRKIPRPTGKIVVSYGSPIKLLDASESALEGVRAAIAREIVSAAGVWTKRAGRIYETNAFEIVTSFENASTPNTTKAKT